MEKEKLPSFEEQREYILEHFDYTQAAEIIYRIGRITPCGDIIPWSKSGFENLKIITAKEIRDTVEWLLTRITLTTEESDFVIWGPIKITKIKDQLMIDLTLTPWRD